MLYTIVFDWKGGTYVSQVRARSVDAAFTKWATNLDPGEVAGMSRRVHERLRGEMDTSESVPLEGLKSVWCRTCMLSGELSLINAIQTDD